MLLSPRIALARSPEPEPASKPAQQGGVRQRRWFRVERKHFHLNVVDSFLLAGEDMDDIETQLVRRSVADLDPPEFFTREITEVPDPDVRLAALIAQREFERWMNLLRQAEDDARPIDLSGLSQRMAACLADMQAGRRGDAEVARANAIGWGARA